jgi:hypothetical protein
VLAPGRPGVLLVTRPGTAYHATIMSGENVARKTSLREKAQLMSASEMDRTMVRLAHEIVEKNGGVDAFALVGIRRGGAVGKADRSH